ncbi:MAG: hypothetical protein ACKO2Z_26845, partial [Sphaerospermopsis kisseleviana]
LKATAKQHFQHVPYQISKQDNPLKIRINPTALLLGLVLICGLVALDQLRYNRKITKPTHRYFTDPNLYLELPQ